METIDITGWIAHGSNGGMIIGHVTPDALLCLDGNGLHNVIAVKNLSWVEPPEHAWTRINEEAEKAGLRIQRAGDRCTIIDADGDVVEENADLPTADAVTAEALIKVLCDIDLEEQIARAKEEM